MQQGVAPPSTQHAPSYRSAPFERAQDRARPPLPWPSHAEKPSSHTLTSSRPLGGPRSGCPSHDTKISIHLLSPAPTTAVRSSRVATHAARPACAAGARVTRSPASACRPPARRLHMRGGQKSKNLVWLAVAKMIARAALAQEFCA